MPIRPAKSRKANSTGRSAGEAKHSRFYRYLTDSPAFEALSHTALAAFVRLKCIYNGHNNGQIFMSERHLSDLLHCSRNTASDALLELEALGFIVKMRQGSFSQKAKIATLWRLTDVPYRERPPSNDYMRISAQQIPLIFSKLGKNVRAQKLSNMGSNFNPDGRRRLKWTSKSKPVINNLLMDVASNSEPHINTMACSKASSEASILNRSPDEVKDTEC